MLFIEDESRMHLSGSSLEHPISPPVVMPKFDVLLSPMQIRTFNVTVTNV